MLRRFPYMIRDCRLTLGLCKPLYIYGNVRYYNVQPYRYSGDSESVGYYCGVIMFEL